MSVKQQHNNRGLPLLSRLFLEAYWYYYITVSVVDVDAIHMSCWREHPTYFTHIRNQPYRQTTMDSRVYCMYMTGTHTWMGALTRQPAEWMCNAWDLAPPKIRRQRMCVLCAVYMHQDRRYERGQSISFQLILEIHLHWPSIEQVQFDCTVVCITTRRLTIPGACMHSSQPSIHLFLDAIQCAACVRCMRAVFVCVYAICNPSVPSAPFRSLCLYV